MPKKKPPLKKIKIWIALAVNLIEKTYRLISLFQ